MKRDVEITSLNLYPLELDGIISVENFPGGVKVHAKYTGRPSLKPKSIGKINITSESLGGFVDIDYEFYIFDIKVHDVDFKKLAIILGDTHVVKSGIVNGTMVYNKRPKIGDTDLKVTEVVLNIPDVDKTVTNVNDAINLNVFHLLSHNLNKKKKKFKPTTDVDHFQFDVEYHDGNFTAVDVALRTRDYRIAFLGQVHREGGIEAFNAYLIDKNGCSYVTQKFTGNIQEPEMKTSTAFVNVLRSTPKTMFGMGKQMMRYGTKYTAQQTNIINEDFQMTSYALRESDYLFNNVSKVVLPMDCKVIYDGKVEHPFGIEKGSRIRSNVHRLQLLK